MSNEERISVLEAKVEAYEKDLDKVDKKLGNIEKKIDRLSSGLYDRVNKNCLLANRNATFLYIIGGAAIVAPTVCVIIIKLYGGF